MERDTLDNFRDQNEFWNVSKNDEGSEGNTNTQRKSDKWWFKVPPTGLSDVAVKWIQFQKDFVNQVLKVAMAINAQNGREILGELIYTNITAEYFDHGQFLLTMDLSTEHKMLEELFESLLATWFSFNLEPSISFDKLLSSDSVGELLFTGYIWFPLLYNNIVGGLGNEKQLVEATNDDSTKMV
ncbi:unnamed protein product [Lupinus luteus]|uniref:PRONE domain-containing protein n=1 Tax=Lupinus luteus TaxID=3873 RepID=A0AAV1WBN1_LUPLU